jgi:DNA polymerase III sliding clamp (beta) subunit (PCNA family)
MGVPYVIFMKHAEKITKSASDSRPILKGVYHANDGSLAVTDAHRLYFAKNSQERKDGSVVNPKTGVIIDGTYPDISRIIPEENDAQFNTLINVKEAVKALKALNSCGKVRSKKVIAKMSFEEKGVVFLVNTEVVNAEYRTFNGDLTKSDTDKEVTFDLLYLIDALELFKDAGYEEVTLYSFGRLRPFIIKPNNEVLALILPVRTY